MKKKNALIIIGLFTFILVLGGVSYSYFVYNKNLGDVAIEFGEMSINFSGIDGNISLTGADPKTEGEGKISTDYIDFTVDGVVDSDNIYYEIDITPTGDSTYFYFVKAYLTDQEDNEISAPCSYLGLEDSEKSGGKIVYKYIIEHNNNETTKTYTKDFRLRLWIDKETYKYVLDSHSFDFNINLYAKNVDDNYNITKGVSIIKNSIEKKKKNTTCNPTWTDSESGIIYLSGDNDCIDFNYVWYSGKLWRITAIYPDGAMKLVTSRAITSIPFNESDKPSFYTDANNMSYAYTWLNEDFYETLYNASNIIDTTKQWNATLTSTETDKPQNTTLVTANIGMLNSFEYYNSYRCISSDLCQGTAKESSYLNISYHWRLINSADDTKTWVVNNTGSFEKYGSANALSLRPAIYIKSNIEFTGNGTSISPYRIVGDKPTGEPNDLINTRLSGEFVVIYNGNTYSFFRIIGVEDNKTKLIDMYNTVNYPFSNNSSDTLWGSAGATASGTMYNYLNTSYLPSLKKTFGDMFDSGTYYYGTASINYKLGVCANTTSGSTSVCTKTSQSGVYDVGLPRLGEMFATQQNGGSVYSQEFWLMNRISSTAGWSVNVNNSGVSRTVTTSLPTKPTVFLKSNVKILEGDGTSMNPYRIGL